VSETRHLLSILVDNSPGELARIVGLFSGRGFNIDSLAVNTTLEADKSRVVLTTRGDERAVEQITKQLNKLVRVYKVHHLQGDNHFERELLLATVRTAGSKAREEVERLLNLCSGRVLSFTSTSITLELSATSAEVDHFIEMLRPLGIRNMVRSAPVAISKLTEGESTGVESVVSV
jgi:acetolactate synthase I/III small subunit